MARSRSASSNRSSGEGRTSRTMDKQTNHRELQEAQSPVNGSKAKVTEAEILQTVPPVVNQQRNEKYDTNLDDDNDDDLDDVDVHEKVDAEEEEDDDDAEMNKNDDSVVDDDPGGENSPEPQIPQVNNEELLLTTGMANAMTRILFGAPSKTATSSSSDPLTAAAAAATSTAVVLSKTKTPLQVQAEKEEKLRKESLETRRLHREKRQLAALHIPLSVATSRIMVHTDVSNKQNSNSTILGSMTASHELEQERMHRRVATRGVVVLFNAIATHQVNPTQTASAAAHVSSEITKGNAKASKLTKHGFLDLIKQTAAAKVNNNTNAPPMAIATKNTTSAKKTEDTPKWNALKDDYMLDSKQNWDEEEDDDDSQGEVDQTPAVAPKKKRHKSRN